MMYTECAQYLVFGPPNSYQSFGGLGNLACNKEVRAHSVFQFIVILALHNLKIFWRVVGSISVNVMNYFIFSQRSADLFFSNYAVFVKVAFPFSAYYFVSTFCNMPTLPVPVIFSETSTNSRNFTLCN